MIIIKYPCHSLRLNKLASLFADDLYMGGEWNCPNKPDASGSSWVWGVWIVFLVETEESRTLDMAPPVVDALRDLSVALARLADALDEASSISLELW